MLRGRLHTLAICLRYLLLYVGVMGGSLYLYSVPGLSGNPLKSLDVLIYSVLSRWNEKPEFNSNLLLIDLPYYKDGDLIGYRTDLGKLLHHLADQSPKVVVLDIAIQRDLRGFNPRGLEWVHKGLSDLTKKTKVYGAVDPSVKLEGPPNSDYLEQLQLDQTTYRDLLDGYGHTLMMSYGSMLIYDREFKFQNGQRLPALTIKVAEDKDDQNYELRKGPPIIVPLGAVTVANAHIWKAQFSNNDDVNFQPRWQPDLKATPEFKDKTVIVGSFDEDTKNNLKRSGPELLAWALNDLLFLDRKRAHAEVLDQPLTLIVGIPVFGLFSLLVFRALQNLKIPLGWTFVGAMLLSMGLLALSAVKTLMSGEIFPQFSLIVVSIVTSLIFLAKHDFEQRRQEAWETDLASLKYQKAEHYDVFISYSRRPPENLEWVKTHVYEPLYRARKEDGTPLRIFFDTDSIKIGDIWHIKLINAIEQSRFFVSVCSDEYFQSKYCDFEMMRADMKRYHQLDFILPLRKNLSEVPVRYNHIQFVDVTLRPDFIHEILKKVMAVDSIG